MLSLRKRSSATHCVDKRRVNDAYASIRTYAVALTALTNVVSITTSSALAVCSGSESEYVSIRQHAYVSIRQHTSAYASIRTSAYVRQHTYVSILQHTSWPPSPAGRRGGQHRVSIRIRVSAAYVSIRQHASAYVRTASRQHPHTRTPVTQHTSAYVSTGQHRVSMRIRARQ